jgi:hypothetical protein
MARVKAKDFRNSYEDLKDVYLDTYEGLKETYDDLPVVRDMKKRVKQIRKSRQPSHTWQWIAGVTAGVLVLFTIGLNVMPERTAALEDVPVLGSLARFLRFAEREVEHQVYRADTTIESQF